MRSKLTLMLVALLAMAGIATAKTPKEAKAAIDMTVPTNLGSMTAETSGQTTDLYAFLNFYLKDNPRPAYIKLTLMPGGEYTCSQPLQINTAFTLEGDANEPAKIMGSSWKSDFIQIGGKNPGDNYKDANGFYNTMYKVEIKNLTAYRFDNLFNSNGKKYLIPNLTIDNCCYTGSVLLKFEGGGVVENVTMSNSTFWGNYKFLYDANGGTSLSAAGINSQKFNVSNCTILAFNGFRYASSATDELSKISVTFKNNICVLYNNIDDFVNSLNANPFAIIQNNAFQNYVKEVGEGSICQDQSAVAETFGASGTIKGNLIFAKYTGSDGQYSASYNAMYDGNMNFTLGDCPQRNAGIGDPRWILSYYTVNPDNKNQFDDDNDLAKVINNAVKAGYTEIVLGQNQYGNARYYLKQPIVADKAISIVAADKNIQIDASQNNGALIQLSKTPAVAFLPKADGSGVTDYYGIQQVLLKDLNITGIKQSILYDNNTKYCVVDMTIDNCVLGLETEQVDNEALISMQAGGIKDFNMMNSTVYGNNAVAKYFIRYNNSARLDRYGFDKNTEFQTMTYQNNTFYGLLKSDGQWGNYNGIAGQNYSKFVVEKNIWYNSSNEIIRRMAGGRFGSNAPQTFDKNTYFLNGADNSAKEAGYDKSGTALTTDPGFKKPAEGDFTLSAYSAQCNEKTGDPRWFAEGGHYNPVTGIETVKTAEETSLENAVIYNLNGQRVEKAQKGINIVNGKKVIIK